MTYGLASTTLKATAAIAIVVTSRISKMLHWKKYRMKPLWHGNTFWHCWPPCGDFPHKGPLICGFENIFVLDQNMFWRNNWVISGAPSDDCPTKQGSWDWNILTYGHPWQYPFYFFVNCVFIHGIVIFLFPRTIFLALHRMPSNIKIWSM